VIEIHANDVRRLTHRLPPDFAGLPNYVMY